MRTTLTHEYGHILLHTWLYDKYATSSGPQLCYWHSMLPTSAVVDWFEWQAGFASGCLLMPDSFMRRAAEAYFQGRKEQPPVPKTSRAASELSDRVSLAFDVSVDAAIVRLSQLAI